MRWLPVLTLAAALAAPAAGEPYRAGSRLSELTLEDQFGTPHTLGPGSRAVLFSRDMDGGRVIRDALAEDGAAFLERTGAVYVADVSRMPSLVRSLMARPAMRRRGYPMLLDERGEPTADFPSVEGRATVLFLDALEVTRVLFVESPDALRAALEPPATD